MRNVTECASLFGADRVCEAQTRGSVEYKNQFGCAASPAPLPGCA